MGNRRDSDPSSRPGDSLWLLSTRRFDVPIWLLRQYNPDVDFDSLQTGTRITIPTVEPHSGQPAAHAVRSGSSESA